MTGPPIYLRVEDGIARLVLNRPPRNETNRAFIDAFRELAAKEFPGLEARGMIVHGAGRHFSSGADTDNLRTRITAVEVEAARRFLTQATMAFQALSDLPFPVVAAVSGCCIGSGAELALACHYRIAARGALFALPETTFDLMPGAGGTVRLPRVVGLGNAIELLLSGRALPADEALRIGLVDLVVEKNLLLDSAQRLIERLAA